MDSEKKYIVPEGMLKATQNSWMIFADYPADPSRVRTTILPVLEAAACWLDGELEKMIKDDPYQNDRFYRSETLNENAVRSGFNKALTEVRSMFISPEVVLSPVAKRMIKSMRGVTLTPADADAIVKELSYVAHGWNRRGENAK